MSETTAVQSSASLARQWAIDWLSTQRVPACIEAMHENYSLLIGGYLLEPRDNYIAATQSQLFHRFPNVVVTTHSLIANECRVALSFTEHGHSSRPHESGAAWSGVALFRTDGDKLTHCFAEEDYYGRRQQLADATPDSIAPPALDPWDTAAGDPDPAAEAVVCSWVMAGCPRNGAFVSDPSRELVTAKDLGVNEIFSVGPRVAFHITVSGNYCGGLDDVDARRMGSPVTLALAGLVEVEDGCVISGFLTRDRLGLIRSLTN